MTDLKVLTYGFGFTSDQGGFGWSTISLLRAGGQNILIDTGPGSRRANLVSALDAQGMERGDIDIVMLTHLHWDHCQNTDLFTNARILVSPQELDYAKNPARGDTSAAWYIADMLDKMKAEPISDGDEIVDGVSVISTPGHTVGHMAVLLELDGEKTLVAGDAFPDAGTAYRKLPYNVFWDVNDASDSVDKMLDASSVFYPGHDRPFRIEGDEVSYLHGPTSVEIVGTVEGGGHTSVRYKVTAKREPNISLVQKPG